MGVVECTALALEEECDDLVAAVGGGSSLECDGGLIVCMSQFYFFKNIVHI
jgi:hypothetical protein